MAEGDTPTSWWAGLDADHQALVTARGLEKLTPDVAAQTVVKSYRELQKLHGGIASGEYIKPPGPNDDDAARKAFYQKLGAPADATGYKFDDLKFSDGSSLEQSFQDQVREAAAAANMPAHMLNAFVAKMIPHMEASEQNENLAQQAAIQTARQTLDTEWGANTMNNKFIASRAMDALRLTPEAVSAMEGLPGVGYVGLMKMFKQLGDAMGEGRFVPSGGGGGAGSLTPEGAREKLAALGNDKGWVKRWQDGGAEEIAYKTNLVRIALGKS